MVLLRAERLYKRFHVHAGAWDMVCGLLRGRLRRRVALDDVSLELRSGETLGVIGANGSGKSTLLKVLAGVQLPESGRVQRHGRVVALLELGTGFRPERTGLDNLQTNGLLLGMTRRQLDERRDAILRFSGLGSAIHEPLKNYSSGMRMRLGFAVAMHAEPDAFLIDEALTVGDAGFQQRCIARLQAFTRRGGAIILVAHDLAAIRSLCDRAVLLQHGRIAAAGAPAAVADAYMQYLADVPPVIPDAVGYHRGFGTGGVVFDAVRLQGERSGSNRVHPGEVGRLCLRIHAHQAVPDLTVGFLIRDRFGHEVFGVNSAQLGKLLAVDAGDRLSVTIRVPLELGVGAYSVALALHTGLTHEETCFQWLEHALQFEVIPRGAMFSGVARLRPEMRVSREGEPVAGSRRVGLSG